ncbi:MAG TPA: NAD(P)H-binding protein [Rhizobacter sp.]|nr:NAD(P)H-binding protein [Rhizobacter sp.]
MNTPSSPAFQPTLVLGGTGKTGRRIAAHLAERGLPVRIGSRAASPAFDWEVPSTWPAALEGVGAVYLSYYPDLAVPGAVDAVQALVRAAVQAGVGHIVLLSGRGEEEAEHAERVVQGSGVAWTILRASWFAQNFSEGYLQEQVAAREVVLPVGDVGEPFVDADDIADVAVAALTDPRHAGQLYELSGPRLLSFAQAVQEIADATGRPIAYRRVTREQYHVALQASGLPPPFVWLVDYLFHTVLDGRNARLADGVQRALGRPPRDFADYARAAAAAGAW